MKAILTFSLLVLLTACGTKDSQQQSESVRSTTIKDILLDKLTYNNHRYQYYDNVTYVKNHIDEVKKTFRVNKIDTCGNVYIAYYSFSIGGDVSRNTTFFTKIPGDTLCIISNLHNMLKNYNVDELNEITKKVTQWKGNDAPWWDGKEIFSN